MPTGRDGQKVVSQINAAQGQTNEQAEFQFQRR
jgi:hypothetical protein